MTPPTQDAIVTRETLVAALNAREDVEAALLYGSVARGDSEPHSDLDLLVLCASGKKREVYDELLDRLSVNVERLSHSMYSRRELQFLATAKSLFLLHLSKESEVLVDRTDWLRDLLRNFEPKETYEPDFAKSLRLVDPLKTLVARSPNQLHRLAYIYSLFRVYGVYLLARKRVFEFSKAKMSRTLETHYPLQADNIRLLSSLRIPSAEFFSGFRSSAVALDPANSPNVARCLAALAAISGTNIDVVERPYRKAVEEFLSAAMAYPLRLGYQLRTWFLLLVYDGLNLYCRGGSNGQITSFSEGQILGLTGPQLPEEVRRASALSVAYLRNYPLKYFLLEESKIATNEACSAIFDLSRLVDRA
jgi:predicted nucleotidyltransferase